MRNQFQINEESIVKMIKDNWSIFGKDGVDEGFFYSCIFYIK